MARPFSQRKARFIEEFLREGNATQALIRAGYSPNGAAQAAHKLLISADVAAEVAKRRSVAIARLERATIATLGEVKEVLSRHLRGVDYDKHLAEMEKDLEALPPGLPRFELRIEILRAISSRNAEAGRAAVTLAKLKGALDPYQKPVGDRKKALDTLMLSIIKNTDGPSLLAQMKAAGAITDV